MNEDEEAELAVKVLELAERFHETHPGDVIETAAVFERYLSGGDD